MAFFGNETIVPLPVLSEGGIITTIIGIIILVAALYIFYTVIKDVVANAILGGIGLLIIHFVVPFFIPLEVPITATNILISLIAGVPGLVAVILLTIITL